MSSVSYTHLAKIGFIRKIFVGLNINSAEAWDICLESEFDTLADVNAYAVHPDHAVQVS